MLLPIPVWYCHFLPDLSYAHTSFCLTKNARRCVSCHAQVTPKTPSWIRVHRTTREFVLSDWSRNSASRSCVLVSVYSIFVRQPKRPRCLTLWKICSRLTSCNLEFKSWTF